MKKAFKQIIKLQRYLRQYDVTLKITGYEDARSQNEDSGVFEYPETIEVTIENWSTSHYSVRTKDLCWVRSGQNLNRTNHVSVTKIFRDHIREAKHFAKYKEDLEQKRKRHVAVAIRELEVLNLKKGNFYLEKGELQKEICKKLGLDYYSVKTTDFESACKNAVQLLAK